MVNAQISLPMEEIAAFCKNWRIAELSLFGSVLREDFRPTSDIDFLVTFAADAHWGLLEHVEMTNELSAMLGRKVHLASRRAIESSDNYIRRRQILTSAECIYAAR
jgi:predicted nucleotidyltransferase